MPPKKRAAPKTSMASATSTRAKRLRASTLNSVSDSVQVLVGETSSTRGTVSLDVSAISATVSAVVSQAIKTAFSPENIAVLLESSRALQPILPVSSQDSSGAIDDAVSAEVVDIIQDNSSGTDTGDAISPLVSSDSRPQTTFTSIPVPLSSRVSSKLKAKIFANEYVDFGALLSSFPHNEGKYSLSMSPSVGSVIQPKLTLELLQTD